MIQTGTQKLGKCNIRKKLYLAWRPDEHFTKRFLASFFINKPWSIPVTFSSHDTVNNLSKSNTSLIIFSSLLKEKNVIKKIP